MCRFGMFFVPFRDEKGPIFEFNSIYMQAIASLIYLG